MAGKLLRNGHSNRRMPNAEKLHFLQSEQKQHMRRPNQWRNHNAAGIHIRIALFITLSLCLLAGCQKPQSYGNFAKVDSVELVRDAVSALMANYPPAQIRLALTLETDDAFGTALTESLRTNGYAVAEHTAGDKRLSAAKKPDGRAFAYVIDGGEDELRVTLRVGDETLSRMYRTQRSAEGPRYIPQGFWTRKQ